jgi:hypothetical protein
MQHKKSLLPLALISWIIIEGCKAPPITITQSQIEAVFTPGRTMRLFWDSTSQPVNHRRLAHLFFPHLVASVTDTLHKTIVNKSQK